MLTKHFPRYLAFKALTFWLLIFVAWLSYPGEHAYSIMSHTFSFLGSWSEEHNPRFWWIFSIAMVFWGVAMIPIIIGLFARFSAVSRWGAAVGAFFFMLGALGVSLVGIFPDARETLYGDTRWTEVHELAAVLVAIGFTLAILWHALLIARDRFGARVFRHGHGLGPRSFLWPYLVWLAVVGAAVYNQATWARMYEARKAAAALTGEHVGSSWSESLHTIYAFPLWENIIIYTLYLFIIWFALATHLAQETGNE